MKKGSAGAGYDQEEAYFYKRDRELIEKMKQRSHLRVIQGGKSESPPNEESEEITELPIGKNQGQRAA